MILGGPESEPFAKLDCAITETRNFPVFMVPDEEYHSALNSGPATDFSITPQSWRFGMVAVPTERVEEICRPLGTDVVIRGFRECAKHFADGLVHLENAVRDSDVEEFREENAKDFAISKACMLHQLTAANHIEFILTRNQWLANRNDQSLRSALLRILRDQLSICEEMLALSKSDSRMGYEGAIGYFYTPAEIIEKIYDIKLAIDELEV